MSRFRETIFTTNTLALSHPTFIDCSSSFDGFDSVTDVVEIDRTPFYTSTRTVQHRVQRLGAEPHVQNLSDRVSELERSIDRLNKGKAPAGNRKYKRTVEIKGEKKKKKEEEPKVERKYKRTAVIKCEKKKNNKEELYKCTAKIKKVKVEKSYKCTAEIKKVKVEKRCKCTAEIKKKSKGKEMSGSRFMW